MVAASDVARDGTLYGSSVRTRRAGESPAINRLRTSGSVARPPAIR